MYEARLTSILNKIGRLFLRGGGVGGRFVLCLNQQARVLGGVGVMGRGGGSHTRQRVNRFLSRSAPRNLEGRAMISPSISRGKTKNGFDVLKYVSRYCSHMICLEACLVWDKYCPYMVYPSAKRGLQNVSESSCDTKLSMQWTQSNGLQK